jgi:hypothetical protein
MKMKIESELMILKLWPRGPVAAAPYFLLSQKMKGSACAPPLGYRLLVQ